MLVDSVRKDAILNEAGDCYELVSDISLEKGDTRNLTGFVQTYKQSDNKYKFTVYIADKKNKTSNQIGCR